MLNESNKRIAKNTMFLYMRMIIIMLVSLYTARIVLIYLGIEDFGIYNVVGGVIVLLGFLHTALTNASQRFITFEIGRNDNAQLKKTFSLIMTSHFMISLIILVLAETIGLWFVNTQLNIAEDRMIAVNWVFQFSVFTFIINILRVPYNAMVVAYEEMSFFAIVSIIETGLKLGVVFLLPIIDIDKLSLYGGLMFLVPLLSTFMYKLYCNRKFESSKYIFQWDKKLFMQLTSFSGWSMIGATANIGALQGGNILLNLFSGVVANAAFGIATQVSTAVSTFSYNLLVAFNPQIIKNYSRGENESMNKLIIRASSYSSYLVLLIAIPFLQNTEMILNLWLKDVPEYAVVFCQLMIIYQVIDVIQAPLSTLIFATGKIKVYHIWLSALLILNVPVSWYLLKIGWEPYWVLLTRVGLNFISAVLRTIYVSYLVNFPSWTYFTSVVFKFLIVSVPAFGLSILIKQYFNTGISGFIYAASASIIITGLIIYFIGINKNERAFINNFLVNFIRSNIKGV
ncbi:lipopolysaccharide biosynthesis protein [Paucihalobacter ruber]|uniref:Lipopolysaccharide biosynthesis protein n=1 Tax=Paucihalobacter ruber TaxID=2567861 RepID=A0A506PQ33_9FLAO|nr:lipopolysaccharide biosynthesis protein [Paucihalobacter ruber]TPV35973.1 lipopolysaccharide biosynthesis protein [Paucihalobacter ruber]